MPLMILKTTIEVPGDKRAGVIAAASRLIAEVTGKPESYVMVTIEQVNGCFNGKECPLAFADVRGIGGLSKSVNTKLSKGPSPIFNLR